MSIAKVIEISAESAKGFEAAIQDGVKEASKSVNNIQSVWVKDQEVLVSDGAVSSYRVHLKVTFVLD